MMRSQAQTDQQRIRAESQEEQVWCVGGKENKDGKAGPINQHSKKDWEGLRL